MMCVFHRSRCFCAYLILGEKSFQTWKICHKSSKWRFRVFKSVSVCTCPPALDAGPPGCDCCSSVESAFPPAPPTPPPDAVATPSSFRGPASERPFWPRTPLSPAPTPLTRPLGWHTVPRSHCSVPAALHAGSSVTLAPPMFVCMCVYVTENRETMSVI